MGNIKIRFFVTLPFYPRILWHAVGMSMWQWPANREREGKAEAKERNFCGCDAWYTHTQCVCATQFMSAPQI